MLRVLCSSRFVCGWKQLRSSHNIKEYYFLPGSAVKRPTSEQCCEFYVPAGFVFGDSYVCMKKRIHHTQVSAGKEEASEVYR